MTKKYLKYSDEFKPGDRSVYYRHGEHSSEDYALYDDEVLFWANNTWCDISVADVDDNTFWCLQPLPPDIERVDSVTKRQIEKALEKEKPKARKRRKRRQWEYLEVCAGPRENWDLQSYGDRGWELVFALNISQTEISLVFKRPKRKVKKSGSRTK